ncbi:major facilitator superfamily domain-containing protein 8-like isoform X3 [Anopheles darlingi]|uniref:major facilitator superfamily domain-containing protein 8-like isoform X3 n=1 Tax=Anopheles darlingi TaxID=43151 RepID=UPI0021002B9B|nr:major facilitator superfamily domain-containing protein 8-like isoform X3 [Anopheles darlingi]
MERLENWFRPRQKLKDRQSMLETDEEYCERWITIRIIYLSGFLMFLSFGVVTTSLWPYLQEMDSTSGKAFLSVLFAAPPGGQLLFSPLIGWCSNRMSSVRILFVLLTALYIFSNALYSVIELFCVPQRKYIMLIARFGFGIATSINTISRAYISAATKFSERTKTIAICSLSQTLGLLVGPLLQSLISLLGKDGVVLCGLRLNMYTSGGWICALGGTMFLLLLSPSTFVHRTIAFKEAQNNKGKSSLMENNRSLHLFPICMIITGYGLLMFFYVSFQTYVHILSP